MDGRLKKGREWKKRLNFRRLREGYGYVPGAGRRLRLPRPGSSWTTRRESWRRGRATRSRARRRRSAKMTLNCTLTPTWIAPQREFNHWHCFSAPHRRQWIANCPTLSDLLLRFHSIALAPLPPLRLSRRLSSGRSICPFADHRGSKL